MSKPSYLSELRLRLGEGWRLHDWKMACIRASSEVDRLRTELESKDAIERKNQRLIQRINEIYRREKEFWAETNLPLEETSKQTDALSTAIKVAEAETRS